MAFTIKDRVMETASLTGVGAVTLGGAKTGYRTFATAFTNGDTTYYCIESANGAGEWEVGLGTYNAGVLTRTTPYAGSAGLPVSFTAGPKNVFCTTVASALALITGGKTFTVNNTLTLSGTDGSTLNVGAGGTLGSAAYTASSAYCLTGDSRLSDSRPASDVYTWAKQASKPTYTYSEVGAPSTTGASASGTWGISITGNSATTSQTSFARVRTDDINRGSYGSISIAGSTANYVGIDFTDQATTWMSSSGGGVSFGVYKSNSTWSFYFDNAGSLAVGTVPWASVTGKPTNVSYFANDNGYITSAGSCAYATSAGGVAWTNVSSRPTAVSSFTNDSGYITASGSCNYATTAGSAPANGGTASYATYLWSTSHGGSYYVSTAWDGTYWQFTSNHGAGVRVARADSAGNASTAGGFTPSQTAGQASRIVVADGNGYIHNNYINTTDNVESTGVSYLICKIGDNYHRSATAGAVQSFLGLGSAAYTSSGAYQAAGTYVNTVNGSSGAVSLKTVNGNALVGSGDIAVASAGLVLLSTVTASSSSSVEIDTTFNTTYDTYFLFFNDVRISATNSSILMRFKISGTYSGSYNYVQGSLASSSYSANPQQTGAADVYLSTTTTGTSDAISGFIRIDNPANTNLNFFRAELNTYLKLYSYIGHTTSGAMTGIRLTPNGNTFSQGKFRLYGVKI
jgi:hypothetical protein